MLACKCNGNEFLFWIKCTSSYEKLKIKLIIKKGLPYYMATLFLCFDRLGINVYLFVPLDFKILILNRN